MSKLNCTACIKVHYINTICKPNHLYFLYQYINSQIQKWIDFCELQITLSLLSCFDKKLILINNHLRCFGIIQRIDKWQLKTILHAQNLFSILKNMILELKTYGTLFILILPKQS